MYAPTKMGAYPTVVVAILALLLVGDIVMAVVLSVVKPTASEGLTSDNYSIVISSSIDEPSVMSVTTAPPATTTPPPATTAAPLSSA